MAEVLGRLKRTAVVPEYIAINLAREFVLKALDAEACLNLVRLKFSRPRKPTYNASAESFNSHFRAENLDHQAFAPLEGAR